MDIRIIHNIDNIDAAMWNQMAGEQNPFLRHEFFAALQHHHAVGERYGWLPHFITLYDQDETLLGAIPMYVKDNSYGELVFDWGWADAHHRHGLNYYPKLVVATPYTPATGNKILLHPTRSDQHHADALIKACLQQARELNCSSLHWLFISEQNTKALQARGFMLRQDCQFHWHNAEPPYQDFDHFLAALSSAKRKNIKRERRQLAQAGIEFEILNGHQAQAHHWRTYHGFYGDTFARLGGYATMSLGFFQEIAQSMPDNVVLILAHKQGEYLAAAFCMRGQDTLYGRHWGCKQRHDKLHFETCYYQGIEYCITHGLKRFEPGAQGEHKLARGFLPSKTHSAHWIAQEPFAQAIAGFLEKERHGVQHYITQLQQHSPYKKS